MPSQPNVREVRRKKPDANLIVNGKLITPDEIKQESTQHQDETNPEHAARLALTVRELLSQKAREKALLAEHDDIDNAVIDQLLAQECPTPKPGDDECRRYYDANRDKFRSADLVLASHILFALSDGVSMSLLRSRAHETLKELRRQPQLFAQRAKELSNCPSSQVGRSLGQLSRGDNVPEFDKVVFASNETGILPELLRTRHGFHIVLIEKRVQGEQLPYDAVKNKISDYLEQYVSHKAIQQYIGLLLAQADIQGLDLDVNESWLVQ